MLPISFKQTKFINPLNFLKSFLWFLLRRIQLKNTNVVFNGWMFASSPALNALEHPVYDLVLIECKKFKTQRKGSISNSFPD